MIEVREGPIDPSVECAALDPAGGGAIATFVGVVRAEEEEDPVRALELEHYAGMTERALRALEDEARRRWRLGDVRVIHRVGRMAPGDAIVFVGASSPHRRAALDACAFLIDRLKTEAPFWKREERASGERWVEARAADRTAAERWRAVAPPPLGEAR